MDPNNDPFNTQNSINYPFNYPNPNNYRFQNESSNQQGPQNIPNYEFPPNFIMRSCIILQNMIVEDERDTYAQHWTIYDQSETSGSSTPEPFSTEVLPTFANHVLWAYCIAF